MERSTWFGKGASSSGCCSKYFVYEFSIARNVFPVYARGIVCDTEQRMLDYYFTYLDLFRSLQQRGYDYRGDDEICFGITADDGIVHMRRGTHRLAMAHFLGLPFVTGFVTHVDPAWVDSARQRTGGGPLEAIALSLRRFQAPGHSQAAAE